MEPKDLKNPQGFKSKQNEEENITASNDEKKKKELKGKVENKDSEITHDDGKTASEQPTEQGQPETSLLSHGEGGSEELQDENSSEQTDKEIPTHADDSTQHGLKSESKEGAEEDSTNSGESKIEEQEEVQHEILSDTFESSLQNPEIPEPETEPEGTSIEEDSPEEKAEQEEVHQEVLSDTSESSLQKTEIPEPETEPENTSIEEDSSEEKAEQEEVHQEILSDTSESSLRNSEIPEPETEPEDTSIEVDSAEKNAEQEIIADSAKEAEIEEKAGSSKKPTEGSETEHTPEDKVVSAPPAEKVFSSNKKIKKSEPEVQEKAITDYSTYSMVELVNALTEILDNNGDHDKKDDIEVIKTTFYRKAKEEVEEQKKQFIESGGNEEDFEAQENPYELELRELLKRYRQIRHEFNKKLEHEKEQNLQSKYEIIEEIKGLIHKEESINKTFQDFRELQQHWREIGPVPQSKMKDLWDTYHFHVESFYDYIKINQELRDLDLKKNLEVKIKLCEQAEELLLESNTIKAFNYLQKLHDRWREAGPVPRENKDDIWERFKSATAKINKKHQDFFEGRKTEQKKNLEAKKALCEQVEEINEMELDTHKDWDEKSKEVVNLQKVWRTIGFAPRKDNNKIYTRFREACDKFFDAKRDFYSKNKEEQQTNLQMKINLCEQAEALKESTDWRKATQELISIQKQWKEIGPVPRKHSDILWKRFRLACDYFFDKKSEHFSSIDTEQVDNLKLKEQLIEEVENFKSTGDVGRNFEILKEFQRRWTEIGHVPMKKKDEVQKKFRDTINKLFDELNLDESNRNLLKFRSKMVSFSESSRGQNKMRLERDKYMTKLKQMENDLILLDNNIGFFAKSKNAESLIEDVRQKIEQTKEKIEFLKNKIRVIDEMDTSED